MLSVSPVRVLVWSLSLYLLAARVQPICAATPLWTQNASGQFMVIDTSTGNYELAPHQVPNFNGVIGAVPTSFTYAPSTGLIYFVWQYADPLENVPPEQRQGTPTLMAFNPRTGETWIVANGPFSALTYRRHDGKIYGLWEDMVVSFDPMTLQVNPEVVEIQPATVSWDGNLNVSNTPIVSLCFDPITDVAYVSSRANADLGQFTLNMETGVTTVIGFVDGSTACAQTFEPMTHELFTLIMTEGPDAYLGSSNVASRKGGLLGATDPNKPPLGFPVPPITSLAFVPRMAGE